MASSVGSFRPNDPLTQGELADLVAALTQEPPRPVADPAAPVTMAQLDARLVRVLDLSDDAALFYGAAAGAGLRPPARFGTEVVARLLGLAHESSGRAGHPRAAARPTRRRAPRPPTRSPDSCSVSEPEKAQLEDEAATFELPVLTTWQQRVLDDRGQVHRLPVRLGRRVRAAAVAVRRSAAGRLRLLGLRLARLQGAGVAGRPAAGQQSPRPDRRRDGRRGAAPR